MVIISFFAKSISALAISTKSMALGTTKLRCESCPRSIVLAKIFELTEITISAPIERLTLEL